MSLIIGVFGDTRYNKSYFAELFSFFKVSFDLLDFFGLSLIRTAQEKRLPLRKDLKKLG